jgi:Domain of unknown function (DUF5615)
MKPIGNMGEKIKFYFDEHMPRAVEDALIERGYEVLMAIDLGMKSKDDDSEHLPFATKQEAVMVTRDHAFAGRTVKRSDHTGLVCWTGSLNDFGGMIFALTAFAEQHAPEEVIGQVFWLSRDNT